jgi:hypothetical protein
MTHLFLQILHAIHATSPGAQMPTHFRKNTP